VRYSLYDRPHIDRARASISAVMGDLALEIAGSTWPSEDQLDRLEYPPMARY
jgi:hypothetical protein